jgi:hypothetical protein
MLISTGMVNGISLFTNIITILGLVFRCLFDNTGPRTTQGLIVIILNSLSDLESYQSLTNFSELYFAKL